MPAMSRTSKMPPAWHRSGWSMDAALLLQDFAESPLGENAFSRGDRQVGAPGDFGEHVDVLALDGLFHEKGLIGF